MKVVAILSVLALIAALVGAGYLYLNSTVVVEALGVSAVEAAAQEALFYSLRDQMENRSVIGTAYTTDLLTGPEDYQFLTYTVRLRNNCFVTADMVEVQVTPMQGDVLQVGDVTPRALPARSAGDIHATILTPIGMHNVRELNVTFYMWGVPFTIRTTYGR